MQLKRSLLNWLWPNRCPGCGTLLLPAAYVCEECGEKMLLDYEDFCHSCGKLRCVCKKAHLYYDKAVVCCAYADEASRAVIQMKESHNTNFAYFCASILAQRIQSSLLYCQPDCVMPVPMHPAKIRKRGYNQAAVLGKELARLLELPYREDMLFKNKAKYAQHELTAAERRQNVSSFGIHPEASAAGLHVLLCDDVLTTGSTMNRCAQLLKTSGAVTVIAVSETTTPPPDWH